MAGRTGSLFQIQEGKHYMLCSKNRVQSAEFKQSCGKREWHTGCPMAKVCYI